MNTKRLLPAVLLGCCLAGHLEADPPALIRVVRNAGAVEPYASAKVETNVLGMNPVAGLAESWLVEMHDSFASIEAVDQALASVARRKNPSGFLPDSDDVLPPARTLVGLYRPSLSYRPTDAEKMLGKAHYFLVSLYRTKPGAEEQFVNLIRLRSVRFDSINLDRADICYELVSGGLAGTYMILTPLTTLKSLDDSYAKSPAYAEGVREAAKKASSETDVSMERLLLRVDPRMSWVSDEFAAADPEFWKK